ncbi:hypothetical protein N665_2316s0002 [Sinapis alba]|nr:hypothetical protein N665_2316s0002 [Sinapis alba]
MSSPLRRCSLKGKAVATGSDSERSGSPLIRRPRTIMLGGMDDMRPTTADLALLDNTQRDIVRYSIELEDRETTGHAPVDDAEQDVEPDSDRPTTPCADIDSSNKDKSSAEKINFALADFLPMRCTGTDFEFDEEIDPEQERTLGVKKNQNWVNHLPTRSTFKSMRRLIFQTNPPAGFSFLIAAEHQRPWTPPAGYTTVYESWFRNCSLWWPLPEFLTTYCHRRKIALGQYTANGIRIMVTLTVLAAELGITMSVRLFEELTTPSITGRTGFFYGKMVPKYNVITGKPSKVNFWNHRYFYVKINEASFEDPSIVLNGYFNANIDRLSKWSQGGTESFLEEVEAIRTLSHQHWPDITDDQAEIQSQNRGRRMGKLNLSPLPSYADTIGTPEHGRGSSDVSWPAKRKQDSSVRDAPPRVRSNRSSPVGPEDHLGLGERERETPLVGEPSIVPVNETEAPVPIVMPIEEHRVEEAPSVEGLQGDQSQNPPSATLGGEVVEYPHAINFNYRSIDVPFIEDHEAPARMFRQIKLKKRGMPELDQLHQDSRYREMARAGVIVSFVFSFIYITDLSRSTFTIVDSLLLCQFFGNANLMVRDYEMKLRAQDTSLEAKTKSLKKKRKEIAELAYKVEGLTTEKNEALEKAELERSRNELLSTELAALKAEKELLDSRCSDLEKEKSELLLNFEMTTRRLRESWEYEVKKERLRVESILRQKVMPTYEKMGQFLGEQNEIQSKLALYSQAKGTREGLEKIQSQGLSMEEVLQKARTDTAHFLEELQSMEIVDASEIDLLPVDLDEHGSNMAVFSPEDIQDLRS